jgi:8-oxo-dGTP pyrophosphatase MutT (NUDIX family)
MHAAATVLLLREQPSGLEVLMMRRASAVSFMGGMWVFPGGRLESSDQSPGALARTQPTRPERHATQLHTMQGEPLEPSEAIGLHVAACREAFEEAGVLLAVTPSGEPCELGRVERLRSRRDEITADAGAFVRMLEEEDLRVDVGQLVYWSHWITPSLEPKRFDTRFFVAPLPLGQEASADLSELTEHAWINPAGVAEAMERGEIKVVPPTLLTLEDLAESFARHGSLAAMLEAERGRAVPPVMPRIDVREDAVRVVMPWDAGYGDVAGEGLGAGEAFPAHFTRRPSSLTVMRKREVRP